MNKNLKGTLNNIFYTFSANGTAVLISAILTLLVPKLLGIKEYSYWQLYMFYTSYVGFFAIGWVDGIYLRYGGKDYNKLHYPTFISQFLLLNIFEIIIFSVISVVTLLIVDDIEKKFIIVSTCISGVIVIAKSYFLFIFESTNRIKEYAKFTKIDRYIYFIGSVLALVGGLRNYQTLLCIDIISKAIALTLCILAAPEITFGKTINFRNALIEARSNILVGINLMMANIASLLIVGVIRLGIERKWSIETFGQISLTLSLSNFLLTMINAVGVVMFPMLRRMSNEKLPSMYKVMRTLLMIPLLAMLGFYHPLIMVLSTWLPEYVESLQYMAILFPICIFESKVSILINTYLKTFRKERWILLVNASTVILSVITTFITVFIFENLILTVASIVVLLAFRSIYAEILLSKFMDIKIFKDIILELLIVTIFIISSWNISGNLSIVIYILVYFSYILIKKKDIQETIAYIKPLIKNKM